MPSVSTQQTVLASPHKIKCVAHDPFKVPEPRNSAFFPKRKQGQKKPIQPVQPKKEQNKEKNKKSSQLIVF